MKKISFLLVTVILTSILNLSCSSDDANIPSSSPVTVPNSFTELTTSGTKFSPVWRHKAVSFNGKIWVIGGEYATGYSSDVWSSVDGKDWTKSNITGSLFYARIDFGLTIFNNKMWVVGGIDQSGNRHADVWSSSDGVNWTLVNNAANFSNTSLHSLTVFNNKMWLIGGIAGTSLSNQIWNSTDGVTWTQVMVSGTHFSPRYLHQTFVFNNKLYVVGGYDSSDNVKNDVWSSSDGITWTQETATNIFPALYYHNILVKNDKLYCVGGANVGGVSNQLWSSSNTLNWSNLTQNANYFTPVRGQASVLHNGDIYVIGGEVNANPTYSNKVWKYNF